MNHFCELTANSITLDAPGTVDLFRTQVHSPGDVIIHEDMDAIFRGANTADNFEVHSSGFIHDDASTQFDISGTGTFDAATDVTLNDNAGDTLNVLSATVSFSGSSIAIGGAGTADFLRLNFSSTGHVSVQEDSATALAGVSSADSLELHSTAGISDTLNATLTTNHDATFDAVNNILFGDSVTNVMTIGGLALFTGANVTVDAPGTMTFGSLNFNASAAVAITEDNSMLISGTNTAATASLTTTTGAITDDATADITVTGNASFTASGAGGAVTIGDNAANNDLFGTLTFNSVGAVNISEDDAMVISGANTAGSASLTAETGTITDDATADMTVTGNTSFTANGAGGAITIGDNAANDDAFGSLTFNSVGAVSITEDNDTMLAGANTANSLNLTSAGSITDAVATTVSVTTTADVSAQAAIQLADNATDSFVVGTAATFLANGANISIGVDPAFVPFDCDLNHGEPDSGATVNFGTLAFDAANAGDTDRGEVQIKEDSSTTIGAVARARSLYIGTGGAFDESQWSLIDLANPAGGGVNLFVDAVGAVTLADVAGTNVIVDGLAIFRSRTSTIDVGVNSGTGADSGVTVDIGNLTFRSLDRVRITLDSDVVLDCMSTADSLILNVTGSITDTDDATVDVTNDATVNASTQISLADAATNVFSVGGNEIVTGSQITYAAAGAVTFGTLNFNSAGAVSISEDDSMVITGANTAASASLAAESGTITDDATADITVTGNASFAANGAGGAITIGDNAANNDLFGSLTFNSSGAVNVSEDDDLVISGANTGASASLTAETGTITDDATADVNVAGNINLSAIGAGGAITIGDNAANNDLFGSVTFNSVGAVGHQRRQLNDHQWIQHRARA